MDKETVIKATESIDLSIITEYCQEMGKEPDKISSLISILPNIPPLLMSCYSTALEYYQIKFGISILKDKDGKIIKAF